MLLGRGKPLARLVRRTHLVMGPVSFAFVLALAIAVFVGK